MKENGLQGGAEQSLDIKIGVLFPGQGTQFVGMCKEFYDTERVVQEMFDQASSCLDINFVKLCFASSEQVQLDEINSQTSIFLVSAAIYRLLSEEYGLVPTIAAGHSLGEYTAIHAAGGLSFGDTLYLLQKRAKIVREGTLAQQGGLLAVMNISYDELNRICFAYDNPATMVHVAEIASFNSPTQMVVSGTIPELELIAHDVKSLKGKATRLSVSVAYHSRLVREAEAQFVPYLVKVDFSQLQFPVVNNIMAKEVLEPAEVKLSLVRQTSSHVLWWQSMAKFADMDIIVEVGPGDKFSKMLRREWPDKPIFSINNQQDIDDLMECIDSFYTR